jgi:ATP-dependent DNA ligase
VRGEQTLPRFDPRLPRLAREPPVGPGWIHEIKHDGFRILAHRRGRLAVFELIRSHRSNAVAVLCAFDLLEVNGEDIGRVPLEDRKRRLAGLLRLPHDGIAINERFSGDGKVEQR